MNNPNRKPQNTTERPRAKTVSRLLTNGDLVVVYPPKPEPAGEK